ncbi:methyltransferase domain-containing protein [Psychroserpens algicola]|uniref:TPMT family class I SAM-dependent methyltransferase n=1 Tax=Psychroserpens algicola TaxID=1719034 RepID=A0ABT0H642_9FLAO|nr:methyltransferase domain-containing protein [Psychroserpens algicola]MCK8479838.1 TPMT family class I SAM-dependent methyltransferase [Psychroserpens algicola]
MEQLSAAYWDNRYKNNDIGWDLGEVSPPLKAYIDQMIDKTIRILIPGGGNSYEAEYLFNKGFKNVYVVDVSKTALDNIKSRVPDFPDSHLLLHDFFDLEMSFDLIFEQTFFCALQPKLRRQYVTKMNELLVESGTLVGVLFNVPLFKDHPPFGGSTSEYLQYFQTAFRIITMAPCYNSHVSRQDKELFVILEKPKH